MGVVDILLEDARQEGIDLGIEKVIENILEKHPTWDNSVIADLVGTTEEVLCALG